MATLDTLINNRLNKSFPMEETNLEDGEIYVFVQRESLDVLQTVLLGIHQAPAQH